MKEEPKLTKSSFYPKKILNTFKRSFSTPGSTFGIALIGIIILVMGWRYQRVSYEKTYKIQNTTPNTLDTREKLLEMKRQQEQTMKDMELYYYYNSLHPQQKMNQILRQNNANDLETFVDESISQRMLI